MLEVVGMVVKTSSTSTVVVASTSLTASTTIMVDGVGCLASATSLVVSTTGVPGRNGGVIVGGDRLVVIGVVWIVIVADLVASGVALALDLLVHAPIATGVLGVRTVGRRLLLLSSPVARVIHDGLRLGAYCLAHRGLLV